MWSQDEIDYDYGFDSWVVHVEQGGIHILVANTSFSDSSSTVKQSFLMALY